MEEIKIFISYSHEDTKLFNEFKKGIEKYANCSEIKWNIWSDLEIPTGSIWHEVIQDAVKNSDAAILLISPSFFVSNYIRNEEFLKFIEKNKQQNFTFFPVLLSDCKYFQWEELVKIQFFNPKGQNYDILKFENKIVPYDYIEKEHLKKTYFKECAEAFEKAILYKKKAK